MVTCEFPQEATTASRAANPNGARMPLAYIGTTASTGRSDRLYAVLKPILACVPSQYGFFEDCPQRQRAVLPTRLMV
jgi:hypothetical protein